MGTGGSRDRWTVEALSTLLACVWPHILFRTSDDKIVFVFNHPSAALTSQQPTLRL